MKHLQSDNIQEGVFSTNPTYELVLFDRLPAEQREMLKDLRKDSDFYGILRPRENSGLGVKSVSRDTALLYLTLQQPGPIPEYVRESLGDRCNQEITRLVLDGVLAVESDGKFLSGSEAAALMYADAGELPAAITAEGFLERLSLEALHYGQCLGITDRIALSGRLYGYNRTPLSPFWKRTLADTEAVTEYLGIRQGASRELLEREWFGVNNPAQNDGWLAWQSRRWDARVSLGDHNMIGCKLYISPRTDHLPEAFPVILTAMSRTRVRHFKVGKDAPGLLRPDKMVAYFSSYEDLIETVEQLKKELAGCPAHGVPFTAELGRRRLALMGRRSA